MSCEIFDQSNVAFLIRLSIVTSFFRSSISYFNTIHSDKLKPDIKDSNTLPFESN